MSFKGFHDDMALSLAWLTRLPVRVDAEPTRTLGQAAWAFPLAGLVVGALGAAAMEIAYVLGAPSLLAAALAVAALILITGGLHEDGLADFADGLGARGGPKMKLAAMRDSHIGTYGALALIISFALRVLALAAVGEPIALILACTLSRAAMVYPMATAPQARNDGAARAAGTPPANAPFQAGFLATVLSAALVLLGIMPLAPFLAAIALTVLTTWIITVRARRALGGITGDVLGAVAIAAETGALVGLVVVI